MKKGIAASKGYAIGNALIKEENSINVEKRYVKNIYKEEKRFEKALELSKKQLKEIKIKSEREIGSDKAEVFESHIMLLEDEEFAGAVKVKIKIEHINAEAALYDVVSSYIKIFNSMKDEYMKERSTDVKDVGNRILNNLAGQVFPLNEIENDKVVIVAHDLTPSDTALLDKSKVVAFVTDIGGGTSHSSIMARTLEIPAVVGTMDITDSVRNGDLLIVDGVEGTVIVNPDENIIKEYRAKMKAYNMDIDKLKSLADVETVTKSGKKVDILANIGMPQDVEQVLENGGEGIGLFRTEFLYINRTGMPSEEEQFEAYKYVVEKMEDKPVVIRTLDIGGDKKLPYLSLPEEMNPFLGYRAIRLCLDREDIFKPQLRAMLRASAFGNLRIMFPMISSVEEFLRAKDVLKQCMKELEKEGRTFNRNLKIGIMVETPAAAIEAEELSRYVDFFSIGTNDLIQYTLAADRMNEKISYLYNPMHPAVLKLIKKTIDAAHKNGKLCAMCGEMAGDESSIPVLMEYGLDEFSMSASSILRARQIIMEN
ncbi:phosphoenolpyruvate--protein phosphotransferase [Clostridium luticellarii]|jgi:phosphotransferase system enzyme I (PtsI)|uniref:Phosphoenolpyruvate-protein phosphotransferase n=1 Tax=Clostridium luticellarii TaxID=1691940 RepID=A0A2T0BSA7_9CLOT|nr:phosphoenolpyruvate--protein phosphotransferase [Clostridium luticellarii]MCI1944727.1 phosphoenolpyruvate--protein phosphotransferase [Clostridium luticellarii]MCI1968224.1 phosphoenolpyruvate--protein phosphotransferase [Clostridium luticellarii]MCI1995231.1 phosphoenolpyruvate--protein phosphotransferase [Clostridium luticellarii]MCI2039772.1 phosphoenolpyruvate--protein phosphotransferase [Clostridium luticellarii]PRR86753.1 Phosphoenolpyruvate-protein phosphotransferase [Clostridium lu